MCVNICILHVPLAPKATLLILGRFTVKLSRHDRSALRWYFLFRKKSFYSRGKGTLPDPSSVGHRKKKFKWMRLLQGNIDRGTRDPNIRLFSICLSPSFLNFKIYLYLFKFLLWTLLLFPKEGCLKINLSIINELPSFPF